MLGRDRLNSTLEMMILKAVSLGPYHGYGIARRIYRMSGDALMPEEGTIYPALHRLVNRELLSTEWQKSENNRRARYYHLTPKGRKRLVSERERWEALRGAVDRVLSCESLPAGES